MNVNADSVRGFQDFLPPESEKRTEVRKIMEKNFRRYGFTPIESPVIEFDELLRSDVLEREYEAVYNRFKLRDRSGRNLCLRYELILQLARIFKQNPNIKVPARFFQIGQVFRDEPGGSEKFRQITQCNADIIGDSTTLADVECLAMLSNILKECKIEAEIQVNNRRLIINIIESVEIKNVKGVMGELDKKGKIEEDLIKANLKKYADSNQIITLFKLLEKDFSFFKENAFEGVIELESLMLKSRRCGVLLKFNPFIVGGLGYYTGNIFEVVSQDKVSLADGGRYEKLVGKYLRKEISAFGISLGLEKISQLAKVEIQPIQVMIISLEKELETLKLAKMLREIGLSCFPLFEDIDKSLEIANQLKVSYVVFVGGEETKIGKYKLKEMVSGIEEILTEKQLVEKFVKTKLLKREL